MEKLPPLWKHCKGFLFHLLPHHLLSRITFWLTRLETPLKNIAIHVFIRIFDVDMSEALHKEKEKYPSFNAFFTRRLIAGARPIVADENAIACPADGRISQIAGYRDQQAVQAKGQYFSMRRLLGGAGYGTFCKSGKFVTIYLSPRDYHRVHIPLDGTLVEMIYVPGRLFSVAPYSAEVIAGLYTRNERVISIFKTPAGYMAVVMVGAVNVAAIETSWGGLITPPRDKRIQRKKYTDVKLEKGAELGVFNMGSTVITAFESEHVHWNERLSPHQGVRVGQPLGKFAAPARRT